MTRTDLLSLAERLALRSDPDSRDACIALRKLAELRPVAWIVHSNAGRIRATWSVQPDAEQLAFAALDGDIVTPLYQLSEVLTDE